MWQKRIKIILIIPYGNNASKVTKNSYNRSYMKFSAGKSFEPDKLDLAGKCALILTEGAIAKNLLNQSLSNFLRMLLTVPTFT